MMGGKDGVREREAGMKTMRKGSGNGRQGLVGELGNGGVTDRVDGIREEVYQDHAYEEKG